MNATSPWVITSSQLLANADMPALHEWSAGNFSSKCYITGDSHWLVISWPEGSRVAFRTAYSPNDELSVTRTKQTGNEISFYLKASIGTYKIKITFQDGEKPVINYTTTLTPCSPLLIPYWPRDIIPLAKPGNAELPGGDVFVSQEGTRSGLIYFSSGKPQNGAALYMQNLTSLNDYCEQTETSCGGVVGGQWPEIGFALPPTLKSKPLAAGKEVILSDTFIAIDADAPVNESAMAKQFLNLLASVYLLLPKPETSYHNWPDVLDSGLKDLIDSPACWQQVKGHHYFNAYACDYATPPEIMVQLAVLLPLLDYVEWSDRQLEVMKKIKDALPEFWNEEIGSVMRWLPAAADKLDGEEEQKKPMVMDSWYLHHPLLNLSRLALKNDEVAKKLFLGSIEFAIKVAHHFNYQWPVFYDMSTLEVIKAETQPGKGGEQDVPGLYAHIMLQAWELTGKKRFLDEAEKAAMKLKGLGFKLFYQANNTSFAAGAMLRLYKATKKEVYKELSYLCLANIFKNVHIWDCNYGYGKHFPSFFALFPLNDAPYTAVYEEQEVFCAFHDYLRHAEGEDIFPAARLLIAEYIRCLVNRAMYYYPTMLPKEMLSDKVKVGEVDKNLWIALEDLHDGWEQSGQVGQEVYGAGNAFGILPRHYMRIPGEDFMVFTDYPTYGFAAKKGKPVTFSIVGDERLSCRLMIVKMNNNRLPDFTTIINGSQVKGKETKDGHIEYLANGNSDIKIDWKREQTTGKN